MIRFTAIIYRLLTSVSTEDDETGFTEGERMTVTTTGGSSNDWDDCPGSRI